MLREMNTVTNALQDKAITAPILEEGAKIVREAVKRLIPVHDEPVKRYKNGKVVATYFPGNLQRSVQILDLKETSGKFVGYVVPPRGKSRGTFKGEKVDGYYARFVEIKSAPLRKGADASSGQAIAKMKAEFISLIAQFNARN